MLSPSKGSIIHFSAVADFEDNHFPFGIKNVIEDSIIADAKAPARTVRALKFLATSWTRGDCEALKGCINPLEDIVWKGGQFSFCTLVYNEAIGHSRPAALRRLRTSS